LQREANVKVLDILTGNVIEVVKQAKTIKPKADTLRRIKYFVLSLFFSFFASMTGNEAYAKSILAEFPYGWDKDIPHRVDMGTAPASLWGLYHPREYDARIGCANCGTPTKGKKFCSAKCKMEWDEKGMRRDPLLAVFPDEDRDDTYEDWEDWKP